MVYINLLFMVMTAYWCIQSEKYSLGWYLNGVAFALNAHSVLSYIFG